ncbi:MAG: hypothetical protein HKM95_04365, partial [Inquilinus sp.]|nr:hypothetical protein [Inquilinus sp.]
MADFETVTLTSQPILLVHRKSAIAPEAIGAAMAEAFGTLMGFMQQSGIEIAGAPLALYRDYNETETVFD